MSYTAVDLMPEWYSKAISKQAGDEEITLRKKTMSEIIPIDSKSIWVDIVKIYLSLTKAGTTEYTAIVDLLKKDDDNFNVQNENLIKVLCGCAIAQKMDLNESYISDALALMIVCAEFFNKNVNTIPELPQRAYNFWINECERKRVVDLDFAVGNQLSASAVKVEIPELSADEKTWKANSDAVLKIITALQKDLNSANAEIVSQQKALNASKQNFVALSEESDILWWLFGAYSSTVKKSFNRLSAEILSVIISVELFKLTKTKPGIAGTESIIHRALSNVEYEFGSTHTIDKIVNSVTEYEKELKLLLPEIPQELEKLCPLLLAVRERIEYTGIEWKAVYNKKNALDIDSKVTYENFSIQLYQELMMLEVYSKI